jgi:hypothetical protein
MWDYIIEVKLEQSLVAIEFCSFLRGKTSCLNGDQSLVTIELCSFLRGKTSYPNGDQSFVIVEI